jgi:hypothetical protein
VEIYWNGSAAEPPPPVVGAPVSPFHTYAEFLSRFGTKNVRRASNKDADSADVDLTAVQSSFWFARDEIYDTFRYGLYAVPFDWTPNGGVVPETVKRWALNLAYGDLYEVRGWSDMTVQVAGQRNVPNKIYKLVKDTYMEMGLYRGGIRTMLALRNTGAPLGITAIRPTGDRVVRWIRPDQVPTYRPIET